MESLNEGKHAASRRHFWYQISDNICAMGIVWLHLHVSSDLGVERWTQPCMKSYSQGYNEVSDGKESVCNAGDPGSVPRLGRFPWRREWLPTPVLLPGESYGQRSLAGYSQSMGSQRVRHDWVINTHTQNLREVSLLHSKCLFGLKPGLECRLWLETHNSWEEGTALLSLSLYLSKHLSQHIIMIFFPIFVSWSFTDD